MSDAAPPPSDNEFDAAFWKAVNAAFDEALECDDLTRPGFMRSLSDRDPRVANEVRRLLGRAHAQTLATDFVRDKPPRPPGLTTELSTVLGAVMGDGGERGFDGLLQRARRAERARSENTRSSGELCGAWRLQEVIGVGGMGEVWLATRADGLYQAKAAVKFLRTDGDAERFEARFAQERALLARLNHPGIARLIDAGRLFGQPFLVLEYVDGKPLLNYVAEQAPTVQARIELIREIGEAVSYAHSQLVVHRDLKPSNVLVTPGGHVKLLDFGVAGLLDDADHDEATSSEATRIGGRGLTVEYAAPEQITGDATGVASDIYSLGALAYHLLAGRRAHLPEKHGRAALEHAVLHTTPDRVSHAAASTHHVTARDNIPPPSDPARLGGDIDAIVARAMRIDPADRYPSMEAFVADLRRWMERRPIAARREDRSYRTRLWLRRNWLPVSLTATLFVALGAGLALSLWQYQRARAEATRANKTADYLVELLGRADPDLHGGKWPSALDLLDEAARDSKLRFRDEPVTEERLARLFAGIYRSLSRDNDALPLARRALALSTELYGENSLNTLRARGLLAWVLYWSDDYTEAVSVMQPVMDRAARLLPAKSPELIEIQLRYANILAGVYRIDEAEGHFRAVIREYQTTTEPLPNRAWRIADAEGDLAAAYTRAGRWQDALNLLRRNAQLYASPPANDLKTALNHQGNLITVQNVLGDPRGVEQTILELIGRWQRLAGERSERIDELLNDLGLYYVQAGLGAEALKTFERLLERATAHGDSDSSNQLRNQLDLVEIRARFNMSPAPELLDKLDALTGQILTQVSPDSPRLRQLLLRAAMVAIALEQPDKAEALSASAREKGRDKAPANATRTDTALASIARMRGQYDAAIGQIERRLQDYEKKGERVSLRHAFVLSDHAYVLALRGKPADRPLAQASLAQARAAIPEGLPPTHRVFAQWNYVNAAAQAGFDSRDAARYRDELAPHFGRTAATMPKVLSGFFVLP